MKDFSLPVVANYLASPPFPYVYTEESIPDSLAESQNESASISSASQCETSPCSSAAQVESICTPTSCNSEDDLPAQAAAEQLPTFPPPPAAPEYPQPVVPTVPQPLVPNVPTPVVPNIPTPVVPSVPQPVVSNGPICPSPALEQARPLQTDSSPTGPAPSFQPFFFTGTFPYNMQGNEV